MGSSVCVMSFRVQLLNNKGEITTLPQSDFIPVQDFVKYPDISQTYVGSMFDFMIGVVVSFTHVLVVPQPDLVEDGVVKPVSVKFGNAHGCSINIIIDVAVVCAVVTEGGMGVAVAVLGYVVETPVSINTAGVGDYTAVLDLSHGGIRNTPSYISGDSGAEIIPAENNDTDVPAVVSKENIKSRHAEITGNLSADAVDAFVTAVVVNLSKELALAPADNIPVILHSHCLVEDGVVAATELSIKRTGGYGVMSGGVAADIGKPDRKKILGKPFITIEFDFLHYGVTPVDVVFVVFPLMCASVNKSCDPGFMSLLHVVQSTGTGTEMSLSCAQCYRDNVSVAVKPSESYFKASRACHLGSENDLSYEIVLCASKNGPGGAAAPGAKGGCDVGSKAADNAKSPMYSVNAGDVKLSTTYFVLIMYLQSMVEQSKVVYSLEDSTCSLAGTENVDDTTVDSDQVSVQVQVSRPRLCVLCSL